VSTRRLIVNADDFGRSGGINRGIATAHEHGVVTSASLMVRWPDSARAAEYARAHLALSVGLHLDLGEWANDGNGWRALYTVGTDDPEAEIRAQLATFRQLVGRDPTHLDSHHHVHRHEPVGSFVRAVGAELGVPVRSVSSEVRYSGEFYGQTGAGEPLPEALSVESLIRIITSLPPGTTELGCHPGEVTDLESTYRDERPREIEALCDPRVRAAIAAAGIELCSFSEL
jgi:chitin disaccharide deacetylase